jgi:hypothetical protein
LHERRSEAGTATAPDMNALQPQQDSAWLESCQYPGIVADGALVPMAGFELLDFANNVGSWILPSGGVGGEPPAPEPLAY